MWSCLPSLRPPGSPKKQNQNMQNTNSSIDMENNNQIILKDRRQKLWQGSCGVLSIAVFYLVSQLLIWGLSRGLAPAKLEFFSSVFGMLLVFVAMMIARPFFPEIDEFYEKHIKSKVSCISSSKLAGLTFARLISSTATWVQLLRFPWSCSVATMQ